MGSLTVSRDAVEVGTATPLRVPVLSLMPLHVQRGNGYDAVRAGFAAAERRGDP